MVLAADPDQAFIGPSGPIPPMIPDEQGTPVMTPAPSPALDKAMALARIDLAPDTHRPPPTRNVVVATVVAIVGSLVADAVLVAIGQAAFPSTRGYVHFQFPDYAKLTVVGVVIACLAWPVVTRITSAPRWLFLRLAVLVTAVLLLPDLWLLVMGAPPLAVLVLVLMHLAIAVVTYASLVTLAPVRRRRRRAAR